MHKLFIEVQGSAIAEHIPYDPHIPNFLQILYFTKEVVLSETVEKSLKTYVVGRLDGLIAQVKQTNFAASDRKRESLYTDAQTNIFLMILTFKSLEK